MSTWSCDLRRCFFFRLLHNLFTLQFLMMYRNKRPNSYEEGRCSALLKTGVNNLLLRGKIF